MKNAYLVMSVLSIINNQVIFTELAPQCSHANYLLFSNRLGLLGLAEKRFPVSCLNTASLSYNQYKDLSDARIHPHHVEHGTCLEMLFCSLWSKFCGHFGDCKLPALKYSSTCFIQLLITFSITN